MLFECLLKFVRIFEVYIKRMEGGVICMNLSPSINNFFSSHFFFL